MLVGLVTLLALFWTEERVRGKYEWEAYKEKWEAKGEHFDFAHFVPPPVPDDQNFFKAPIWSAAFKQRWMPALTPGVLKAVAAPADSDDPLAMNAFVSPVHGLYPPFETGSWSEGKITNLGDPAAWHRYFRRAAEVTNLFPILSRPRSPAESWLLLLSRHDRAIEALRRAGRRPQSRLPLDYGNPSGPSAALMPIVIDLRGCIHVLNLRAAAELAESNTSEAFSDVKLMFRLTDSIRNQPLFISQMVRVAMMAITLDPVYAGLPEHRWDDTQLAGLEAELAKEDFLADYDFTMRGERAFGFSLVSSSPRYRLNPFRYQYCLALARMYRQWVLPVVDLKARTLSPTRARRLQQDEATAWKHTTLYNILVKTAFRNIRHVEPRFALAQAGVDLARVGCALERYRLAHGEYPVGLDELASRFIPKVPHDLINGQPLHYRRTPDGRFVLYSVGWNGKDDGGVRSGATAFNEQWLESGDWVWEYPASHASGPQK